MLLRPTLQLDVRAVGPFLVAVGNHVEVADERICITARDELAQRHVGHSGRRKEGEAAAGPPGFSRLGTFGGTGVPSNKGFGREIGKGSNLG